MGKKAFPVRLPHDVGVLATPHWLVGETPAWVSHIPFAFWVVSAAEPRVIVELGCHYGNSYFAFAQSAVASDLPTSMFAIDTWAGDEHSGLYGSEVFDAVRDYNDKTYATFSQLVRSTFDEAVDQFEDGTIDLLHIDGHHTYEAVQHDFESWLPKMSDRGVVLFHDIAVRERGFGVHRLWDELASQHVSFAFEHSHGLGVLAVGSDVPNGLQSLFALDRNSEEEAAVHQLFATLGRRLAVEATLEVQVTAARDAAAQQVTAAQSESAMALDAARVEHAKGFEALRSESADELAAAQAGHVEELEAIHAEHREELARVKAETERALAALQIQIDLAEAHAANVFDEKLGSIVAGQPEQS